MNEKTISQKEIYGWNIFGSLCNAFVSVILMMIITRITGEKDGGIFALAFAAAQLMFTIGGFEMRVYQSTDVNEVFKFKHYLTSRIITCSIMLISTFVYTFAKGWTGTTAIVVILMSLYKLIEALSDVFQGLFQQHERLDLAGKSLALRVITSIIAFALTLYLSKNLVLASLLSVIISIICFIIYDLRCARIFTNIEIDFNINILKKLFITCLPLFITAFLIISVYNSPKISIDKYMNYESQAYFNILFMPASVINLLNIVFRPLLTTMAIHWNNNNIKKFLSVIIFIVSGLVGLTFITIIGGYILGIPVLSIMYSCDLSMYKKELIIILIGGGFCALSNILSNIITIMRQQRKLVYAYIVTWASSFIISNKLVESYGIYGASISYLILMIVFFLLILALFFISLLTSKKSKI